MIAPGPDETQLHRILTNAMRTPDHGKLAPWRFFVIGADQRKAFEALLKLSYREARPGYGKAEAKAIEGFAHQAPALVVVLSLSDSESHIPIWEQELSAGAACMNLLIAAHAEGFVGAWLTGWAAYSETVRSAFAPAGRIAGFIFIGTPTAPPDERPRPAYDHVVSTWEGSFLGLDPHRTTA